MIPTPELSQKVAQWRAKAADGSITPEELQEAVLVLRQSRISAYQNSTKPKASKAPINTDALLDSLKGI